MAGAAATRRPGPVQSVDRALLLLRAVGRLRRPCALGELAAEVGLGRTTAYRLLATLEAHRMVEREPLTGRYVVGPGALELGVAASSAGPLRWRARPALEALSLAVRETVNLNVLERGAVLSIDQIDGPGVLVASWLGRPVPLHATPAGHVALAWMDPAERDAILAGPLQSFTPATVTDPVQLQSTLAAVRQRGYALVVDDVETGLAGVSAPVLDDAGRAPVSLSVWGPSSRLTAERLHEFGRETVRAAARVAAAL
jgi:IclR family acetate operon transcriptional repressor